MKIKYKKKKTDGLELRASRKRKGGYVLGAINYSLDSLLISYTPPPFHQLSPQQARTTCNYNVTELKNFVSKKYAKESFFFLFSNYQTKKDTNC